MEQQRPAGEASSSKGARAPMEEQQQMVVQMQRPGFGTQGNPVDLRCNHFRARYQHTTDAYQYNVSIEPEVKNKTICRKVIAKLHEKFGQSEFRGKNYAFDGEKILYTVGELPFNNQEFEVFYDEDKRSGRKGASLPAFEEGSRKRQKSDRGEFRVTITLTSRINMGCLLALIRGQQPKEAQDALRVLDVVLREHASRRGFLLIRESFFHSSLGKVGDIGEGVETWMGYDVSFKSGQVGLSLNLDLSTTTMIKPLPVMEFLGEQFRKDPRAFNQLDWTKAKRVLKGIRIEATHTGLNHKILGFSLEPVDSLRFSKKIKDQTGAVISTQEIRIIDYYQTTYNIRIRDTHLPCLDVGKANRPVYLPLEFCRILPGQRYTKKLSPNQRTQMILESRQPPDVRRELVQKALDVNEYRVDKLLQDFNIQIEGSLIGTKGRVLDSPAIRFGRDRRERPQLGRWNLNYKIMESGAEIKVWAVANLSHLHGGKLQNIVYSLMKCCQDKGMGFSDVSGFFDEDRSMQGCPDPEQRVVSLFRKMQASISRAPDLVLGILPAKGCDLYAPFKRHCETVLGVVSQCIVPPSKLNDQYFTNVALKINAKCGGYNYVLASWLPRLLKTPTMIFGMDISHGAVGDSNAASIAAVVASSDQHYSKYASRVKIQEARLDTIEGLYDDNPDQGMVRQLLLHFYATNQGLKPQQIVIYRDGVSESQFSKVLEKEYLAFKKVFQQLQEGYSPNVTFIIVQKRHHTRFFPVTGKDNVYPGTVVDRDVVHQRDYDFFLCSHFSSNKGTSRPTHYNVLVDENGFSPDELQTLTNCLCYTYARSTTAISVVAPIYYAHLAAKHCQNCLEDKHLDTASQASGSSSFGERGTRPQVKSLVLHKNIRDKMFFC